MSKINSRKLFETDAQVKYQKKLVELYAWFSIWKDHALAKSLNSQDFHISILGILSLMYWPWNQFELIKDILKYLQKRYYLKWGKKKGCLWKWPLSLVQSMSTNSFSSLVSTKSSPNSIPRNRLGLRNNCASSLDQGYHFSPFSAVMYCPYLFSDKTLKFDGNFELLLVTGIPHVTVPPCGNTLNSMIL